MTAVLVAFVLGVMVATLVAQPRKARHAGRAGWEVFAASVADALLLFDLKGVYSHGTAGLSNPATTGESPHQICT